VQPVEEAARIALEHSLKSYIDRLDAMQARWAELWDGGQRTAKMLARSVNLLFWRKSVIALSECDCGLNCWATNQGALQKVFFELEAGNLVISLANGDLLRLPGVSV